MIRAILLRIDSGRILRSINPATDPHVVRIMQGNVFRANQRIKMQVAVVLIMTVAPLLDSVIPGPYRLISRNTLVLLLCIALIRSGESDADDRRYLRRIYTPMAAKAVEEEIQ